MDTNAQIQIHFPSPGDWDNFEITALWTDAENFSCRRTYLPQDIPAGDLGSIQEVVAGLVGLEAPWQATHAAARLDAPAGEAAAVVLELHARRADGACRSFSPVDYPQLRLTDASIISAFCWMAGGEADSEGG